VGPERLPAGRRGYRHGVSDRPRACVFAPSPLLTVTIEAAPDEAGDAEIHFHPGGQGFWVARMLAELDIDVVLCVALGGEAGAVLRHLLADPRIRVAAVDDGTTGAYLHDRRTGDRVEIARMAEGRLSRHGVDDLYDATLVEALAAGVEVNGAGSCGRS
jgi:1-phosphofructokinase